MLEDGENYRGFDTNNASMTKMNGYCQKNRYFRNCVTVAGTTSSTQPMHTKIKITVKITKRRKNENEQNSHSNDGEENDNIQPMTARI